MPVDLHRLPSLDLLRGFVAVGRHMSITRAASELCLTQSAVSRQVQALEDRLGARLFRRGHRSLAFTAEGERLFRSADAALQQLQDALGAVQAGARTRPVTVSATIGFTGLWLLPRLSRFQAQHPGVDVRVSAHNRVVDLRNDGVDLAIRYTSGERAPPGARLLFHEAVVPVASPAVAAGLPEGPEAIAALTLLEFEKPGYPWIQWLPWLAAHGWGDIRPRAILHFNQYDLVIQAALAGQGVALGRRELIRPWLEEGRLVVLDRFPVPTPSGHGYWLLQAEADSGARQEVAAVAAWIMEEARREHEAGAAGLAPP